MYMNNDNYTRFVLLLASDWPEIPSMFPPGGASPNHHPIPGDAGEIIGMYQFVYRTTVV